MFRTLPRAGIRELHEHLLSLPDESRADRTTSVLLGHLMEEAEQSSVAIAAAVRADPHNMGVLILNTFRLGHAIGSRRHEYDGFFAEMSAKYGLENYTESDDETWRA